MVAAMVVAGLASLVLLWLQDRRALRATPFLWVWVAAFALSAIVGFDMSSGLKMAGLMAMAAIFFIALVRFYAVKPVAGTVIGVYILFGLFVSALGIWMVHTQQPYSLYAINHGRATSIFVEANQFAAFLLPYLAVTAGVAFAARNIAWKVTGAAGFACGLVALEMTYSRGAWAGFAAGALFFAWIALPRRVALALTLVALALVPAAYMLRDVHHNPADDLMRLSFWSVGLQTIEHFPLAGVGPMAYWHVYPAMHAPEAVSAGAFGALHPHNLILSLWAEIGTIGLAAIAYGWTVFGKRVQVLLTGADARKQRFTYALAAGLVATFIHGLVDSIGVVEIVFVWVPLMALTLASARFGFAPSEAQT